jgi:aryl-alcohol dehydrogenase-like predicted oxidoreductase
VEIAVKNGYRHLDLAFIYENQDEVGAALKKVIPSVVKREELFITSKVCSSLLNHRLVLPFPSYGAMDSGPKKLRSSSMKGLLKLALTISTFIVCSSSALLYSF